MLKPPKWGLVQVGHVVEFYGHAQLQEQRGVNNISLQRCSCARSYMFKNRIDVATWTHSDALEALAPNHNYKHTLWCTTPRSPTQIGDYSGV